MAYFFLFTLLSAAGCFVLGLTNPAWLKPLVRGIWTRGRIALVFSGAAIFSFFGVGLTAPPVEHADVPAVVIQQQEPAVVLDDTVIPEDQQEKTEDQIDIGADAHADVDAGEDAGEEESEALVDDEEKEVQVREQETVAEEPQDVPEAPSYSAPTPATETTQTTTTTSTTSGANYYTNVDGNTIESPSANTNGATGVCNDGTYTHAVNHRGACSHHGGVSYWL